MISLFLSLGSVHFIHLKLKTDKYGIKSWVTVITEIYFAEILMGM
jgi:hypothetical protein